MTPLIALRALRRLDRGIVRLSVATELSTENTVRRQVDIARTNMEETADDLATYVERALVRRKKGGRRG